MKERVRKKHLFIRIVVVALAFLVGMAAVQRCAWLIREELQKQVEQNLRDVAEQTEARIDELMDTRGMLLSAMCVQMSDEEDTSFLIDQFKAVVEVYDCKRIGFADASGMAYTTDGCRADISQEEYFQRAAAGETLLTDSQPDGMGADGEYVNIYCQPVYWYEDGHLMGVMFTTYRTETFSRLVHVRSFDDQGTSCIFQEDGIVVAATDSQVIVPGGNLFRTLKELDPRNEAQFQTLLELDRSKPLGGVLTTFYNGDTSYFFFFVELESRPGWFMASIVPADVISLRTAPVMRNVQRMLGVVLLVLGCCVVIFVWTSHKQNQELYRLAYTDPLTGRENYSAFRARMRGGAGVSGAGYVISADLRNFSTVNETCGVLKGDEVIREMSKILYDELRRGELCAHVSGDAFVMFLHADTQQELIERVTGMQIRIMDLSPLLDVPHIQPLFGICAVGDPSRPEYAYGDANAAKRRFKEKKRTGYYTIFDSKVHEEALELQRLEATFQKALDEHRFEMWYQPKYDPESGELVAAEALVRWREPDGSLIPPGKFIPLFERNGMIAQLDEYTFEAVCAQQRAWQDEGKQLVPVSVNVSRASLRYSEVVGRYMVIANRHGVDREYVELEITESAMENNADFEELIGRFRSCGFHILMDDFGSGYSSLYTLTRKYFDNIKIDKSLTDCIGTEEGDSLLGSIVDLAHQFNMTVTAEGVEAASQVDFLKTLSCDNIQGYYYSKPLKTEEFAALLLQADPVPVGAEPIS